MNQSKIEVKVVNSSEMPTEMIEYFSDKKEGSILRRDGLIFLFAKDIFYILDDNPINLSFSRLFQNHAFINNVENLTDTDAWRAILTDPSAGNIKRIVEAGYKQYTERCVVLFRSIHAAFGSSDQSLFMDIVPVAKTDRIIQVGFNSIVLIMSMKGRKEDESVEFASAIIETMESETGSKWCAGIGCIINDLSDINKSYHQAENAIETGLRLNTRKNVYIYKKQILERIIESIPESVSNTVTGDFFNLKTKKTLTKEMMETIETFFQNNLNLSVTARQLFIHRNTLIYRLDKIKKETGLDIRRFQDAVAFRILLSLPKKNNLEGK